jgi:hypothetical protein
VNLELFVQLWNEGKTGLQMAEELGTTRSAVLGKAARLQAKGVIGKRIDTSVRTKRPRIKPVEAPVSEPKPTLQLVWPVDPVYNDPPVVEASGPVSLMELKMNHCRFVVTTGDTQTTMYCGQPKARGSYCGDHAKLCYTKSHGKGDTRWRSLTRFQLLNFMRTAR